MALRKALTYSRKYARPYTRVSRNKAKAYIKVVPHNKIAKYTLGNEEAFRQGKFPFSVKLIAMQNPGKEIYFIACINDHVARIARDALITIKPKMPGPTTVKFESPGQQN